MSYHGEQPEAPDIPEETISGRRRASLYAEASRDLARAAAHERLAFSYPEQANGYRADAARFRSLAGAALTQAAKYEAAGHELDTDGPTQ